MPEKFSNVGNNKVALLGANPDFLAQFPELSILAMQAIASWSNVEYSMRSLFVSMLGGNKSAASAIYMALESDVQKAAAIRNASSVIFAPDSKERAVLAAILAIAKTNSVRRNKLAHWTWGVMSDTPDALLLSDPRASVQDPFSWDDIEVYRAPDFRSIIADNIALRGFVRSFMVGVFPPVGDKADHIFARLCAEPAIREKVDHQASKAQSTQK